MGAAPAAPRGRGARASGRGRSPRRPRRARRRRRRSRATTSYRDLDGLKSLEISDEAREELEDDGERLDVIVADRLAILEEDVAEKLEAVDDAVDVVGREIRDAVRADDHRELELAERAERKTARRRHGSATRTSTVPCWP